MNDTTKKVLILLGITTVAAGGYVAYRIYKKKKSEEEIVELSTGGTIDEVVPDEDAEQPEKFIFGDEIAAMPEPTEIERTEYATKAEKYSTESEEEAENCRKESETDDEEYEAAFEVSKNYDEYRKKNKNKIIVLPEDRIRDTWNREIGNDPSNPDVCYEEEELYYFTEDDTLTDEDGAIIDEEQYLGVKPRQFGWFTNEKEDIYVRNNPFERDFRVNKVFAERAAYF